MGNETGKLGWRQRGRDAGMEVGFEAGVQE